MPPGSIRSIGNSGRECCRPEYIGHCPPYRDGTYSEYPLVLESGPLSLDNWRNELGQVKQSIPERKETVYESNNVLAENTLCTVPLSAANGFCNNLRDNRLV